MTKATFRGLKYDVRNRVMIKTNLRSMGEPTRTQPNYKRLLIIVEVIPSDLCRIASVDGTEGRS